MKILKVGDIQKAVCHKCKAVVAITFQLRNVPFSDGSGIVKAVLVGVCDDCDSFVLLPSQSTPAVKRQLERRRRPLESRVPAHMIDILNVVSTKVGGTTDFNPHLIKYYLHALSTEQISPSEFAKYLDSELFKGRSQKRLSITGCRVVDDVNRLKDLTKVDTTSAILKGIVLKIRDDILVHKSKTRIAQLKAITATVA